MASSLGQSDRTEHAEMTELHPSHFRRRKSLTPPPYMSQRLNLVVCGSDGAERSSISDLILGQRELSPESSSACVRREGEVCGHLVTLVEMLALYNTQLSEEEVMQETLRCVSLCHPGVHAFLLIIPEGRLTDEDKGEIEKIQVIFGSRFNNHTILLITADTQQEGMELDEATRTLTEACRGGHYHFGLDSDVSGLIERVEQLMLENNIYTPLSYLDAQIETQLKRYKNQITEMKATIQTLERKIQRHSEGVRPDALRIVLLGKTGTGKSATGNTILGKQHLFRQHLSPKSVTTVCQKETAEVNARQITVIDTPGLFDTQAGNMEISKEITKCISMAAPGPHVFLLVLKVGQKFSEEEKQAVKIIQDIFGEESVTYTMVLFTGGDLLEIMSIEDYLGEPGSDIMSLIEQCGNRYHVFNNKETRDQTQVTDLLEKIDSMVTVNGGSCYTNEMFRQVEKKEQEEQEKILKERVEEIEREKEELKAEIEQMKKAMQEEIQNERKRREEEFNEREERLRREMEEKEEQLKHANDKRAEEYENRRKNDEKRFAEREKTIFSQMERQRAEFERQRHEDQIKREQEDEKRREREEQERREWDERRRKEREEYESKIEELKRKVQNDERRRAEEEKKRSDLEERMKFSEEKHMKELEELKHLQKELQIRVQEEEQTKEKLIEKHQEEIERMRRSSEEERLKQETERKRSQEKFKEREQQLTTRYEAEKDQIKKTFQEEMQSRENERKRREEEFNEREERLRREMEEKQEGKSRLIEDLLSRLGLHHQHKLTAAHFLEITPSSLHNEEPREEKELVHTFMQELLRIDYRARNIFVKAERLIPKSQNTVLFGALSKKHTENKEKELVPIHPMDVQMAVFLCADPFLQQTMVTKLSQCQYSVPLLVPNPFSGKTEFPLWTMRQISKSWKTTDVPGKKVISRTLPMWKAQTPMVAFFRISTISSSKSQLMNWLINGKHETFFHRNCRGSSRDRLLMDGVVEIAWYCPSGKSSDHFTDCVAFCNLHGDSSTNVTQRKILTEMASVNVALLPNLDENDTNMVILQNLFESSTPLIVILTDEEDDSEDAVCQIGDRKYKLALKGRNQSEVSVALREVIKKCIFQQPVTFKLENITKYEEVKLDEKNKACERGQEAAKQIRRLLQTEDPSTVKDRYLPCQGKLWREWCQKNKDLQRLKSHNIEAEKSKKQEEMREIRKKQQRYGFNELMGLFVGSLRSLSDSEKLYFLKWTAILLDDFTSEKLSSIHQEYDQKWADVLALKKKQFGRNSGKLTNELSKNLPLEQDKIDKLKAEQSNLEKISNKLNAATFGLEHMLREMGQIYEASVSEKQGMQKKEDGDLSYLPGLAAHLMISGHPVELMDGNAAHVPLVWISAVLDEVINKLGDQRVFVLSVLGIQSSGKSTMLNAMFGLQFAVSAGRCTKGAFMQLVKVSEEKKKELKFDYILVVDTEGLRALELAGKSTIHHDNKLATFVVGLGNMTLINIFGENPSEMQEILQIVVQAFMRMKQVKLNPSCMFVHQNVTDTAAADKIMEGRRRLQDKLDEMTKLAAKDEVYDAESFSDVIAFDVQNDVKYFAQLWEGSPPMAPPNPSYSENVQELKQGILSRASKTNAMKLSQFQQRVKDLWNALLNENFVFSFRNTLEISVYRKLEEEYEKWTWSLRSAMLSIEDKMLNRITSGKMETVNRQELVKEMAVTQEDVQRAFKAYFEEDSEREILIQWKCRFETQIQNLHNDLVNETKRKLDDNIQQKTLDLQRVNYEKALFEKSKELALQLKEDGNKNRDPKSEFDSVWGKWVSELTECAPKIRDADISKDVTHILGEFYEYGLVVRQKQSRDYRNVYTVADYQNYVSMKKKIWGTFPSWGKSLKPEDQKSINKLIFKVIQQTTEKVNSFPVSVQGYSATYIQDIVRDVKHIITDFKSECSFLEFKKEFFVDLSLYVCEQAEVRFAELHRKYKEANDPLIYFEKKKAEYFKVFENYWKGATSAAVLGEQICSKLWTNERKAAL